MKERMTKASKKKTRKNDERMKKNESRKTKEERRRKKGRGKRKKERGKKKEEERRKSFFKRASDVGNGQLALTAARTGIPHPGPASHRPPLYFPTFLASNWPSLFFLHPFFFSFLIWLLVLRHVPASSLVEKPGLQAA